MAAIVGSTVPDYRGRFLRHVGGNSAALGVAQGDAVRKVTGQLTPGHYMAQTGIVYAAGAFYIGGTNFTVATSNSSYRLNSVVNGIQLSAGNSGIFDISRVVPTAVENRPVNVAVKYIICAKE